MSQLSDPFYDGLVCGNGVALTFGFMADGFLVTIGGNLEFKTAAGNTIAAFPVVAGQIIPFRASGVTVNCTATVIAGRHS